jgi:glycosyltransferase involved in cell wall biosynthesis
MPRPTPPTVSVIVPIFDEAENLPPFHGELTQALEGLQDLDGGVEILYVDDGSGDGSPEILRTIARADPRVRVLRLDRNRGQSMAFEAGFDHARGQILVTLDGDRQNDPRDIPRLIAALESGVDLVVGWRRWRRDGRLRTLLSQGANHLLRLLTGLPIHDTGCSLKAFRRHLAEHLDLGADGHRFIPLLGNLAGGTVRELEVHHRSRPAGRSKYGLGRVWRVFLDLFTLALIARFREHPTRYFAVLALPFFLLSGLATAGVLLHTLDPGEATSAVVLSGVALLTAFAALDLLLVGLLGELLFRAGDGGYRRPVRIHELPEAP